MKYLQSAHCGYLGRPRDIFVLDNHLIVSSYDHDALYFIDRATLELKRIVRNPHMVHPRGLYHNNGNLYTACYGNPIGRIVIMSLASFDERSHFPVPRPRGIIVVRDRVYVTEVMQDRIGVYHTNGKCDTVLAEGLLCRPRGLTRDTNKMYVADSGTDRIVAMTFKGRLLFAVNGIRNVNDVSYCNGGLYATEWYEKRLVWICDKRVKRRVAVPEGSGNLAMLTASARSRVFVSDDTLGCIHVFSKSELRRSH